MGEGDVIVADDAALLNSEHLRAEMRTQPAHWGALLTPSS